MTEYLIEPLAGHDRLGFKSGSEGLDDYFHNRITQDVRRRIATAFVAVAADEEVAGFYTLAATSLDLSALSAPLSKKLPRYPVVPAILLGRMAVSIAHQGLGLGSALVADALLRSSRSEIAAYALVVDAKDDDAVRFYQRLGFERLPDSPRRLIRPLTVGGF